VRLWISAKIALHHHAQLAKHAKPNAKLLISRNTMSATIMIFQVQQR
jgi:hypothetical protein